jgi:hypothetical protein
MVRWRANRCREPPQQESYCSMNIATRSTIPVRAGAAVARDVVSPAPRDAWRAALAADPTALPSQDPAWLDTACTLTGGTDASRLYDFGGGRHAVLPLLRRGLAGPPLATAASFPPGWGIGGLVAPGGTTAAEVAAVLADLAALPYLRTFISPNPLAGPAWAEAAQGATPVGTVITPVTAHVLDLAGGFERVWAERFKPVTRRNVRKAEREGVVVKCDVRGELVPVYYELYLRSLDRWAERQHVPRAIKRWRGRRWDSQAKLAGLVGAPGGLARLWVAWHDGRPAAGILVLQGEHNAHYFRGVMDREVAAPTKANYLLLQLAIEEACAAGCRSYHMGQSGSVTSIAEFKEGFGARAVAYADYSLERLPLTPLDRRLRGLIKAALRFRDT